MATLTTGKVLKYTLLPGFWPRLRTLFSSGFAHVAYAIALVYHAVRLLPANHPYLDGRNFGRYGIRHVIAEAANNLVISRRNIDQVIMFFTIFAGLILLLAQFVLLIVAIVYQQPAYAAAVDYSANALLTVTSTHGHGGAAPSQDIAFILLDRVFGLRNIYNSCIADLTVQCLDLSGNNAPDTAVYPFPFHTAFHALLHYYSLGIFYVAVIIILYFVVTVVGETAVTGSPFGQRFNKTWAPVRLILFFALLVPLNTTKADGLNGAQFITFWTAKLGSNFATNAWGRFNTVLVGSTYMGQAASLIATPNYPEVNQLVRFMFVAKTCKITEEYAYEHPGGVQAYLVRESSNAPYFLPLATANYAEALTFTNYGNIEVRFGVQDDTKFTLEKGKVKPFCGSLSIPVTSRDTPFKEFSGSYGVQEIYFNMIKEMWNTPANPGGAQIVTNASCIRDRVMQLNHDPNCIAWPSTTIARGMITYWQDYINISTRIPAEITNQINNNDWGVTPRLRAAGWAGAAIWYNRIAQLNGEVSTAIISLPQGDKFPFVMEAIAAQNKQKNESLNPEDAFDPALGGGVEADYPRFRDRAVASVLYNAYTFWKQTETASTQQEHATGNSFIDGVNLVFGTSGIYSMRENVSIHPLAQLSSLGKSMMDAAVRNLAVGFGGGGLAPLLAPYLGKGLSGLGKAASDFIFSMGKVTILMSFILYYVLPFLPFIYFMFAVSGWIKSIFEAVVAMPLWALAHISRMDGQGIAGPGANNGYFLLLEIFLRPILILFGLLASLSIFSASVSVLNDVFKLLVVNATGFDMAAEIKGVGPSEIDYYRGNIDKFFFSVMYVIMCYMMAMGFFKMIDQVPNNILRWMGVSVSTFSEAAGDPAGQLTGKVYQGGSLALGQIKGGGQLAALFGRPG